jgi:hypothetical protein
MVIIVVIVNILNTVIPRSDLAANKENELILNYSFLRLRPKTRYYDAFFLLFSRNCVFWISTSNIAMITVVNSMKSLVSLISRYVNQVQYATLEISLSTLLCWTILILHHRILV